MSEQPISIYAYPWDLYDEGPEAAARRLAACGFNTVHLAVSYHLATYLLPRNPRRSVFFGNTGSVYFRPDPAYYRGTVQPVITPEAAEIADALPQILKALRAAGISPRAWVVYCYNHALGAAHPHLAKVDALGNVYTSQLCVGNPRVQALARGMTRDILEHYDFDGLFIESLCYLPYRYGFMGHKAAVEPSERAAFLLGLCFCDGCRAAARAQGVDADRLRCEAARWLRDHFSRLPDPDEQSQKADEAWIAAAFDGALAAFLAARSRTAAKVIHEVMDLAPAGFTLECFDAGGLSASDAAGVRRRLHEDCVIIHPGAEVSTLTSRAAKMRAGLAEGARVIGALYPPAFASPEALNECLAAGTAMSVDGWRVYNYGILSERQLDWIKRAGWMRPLT